MAHLRLLNVVSLNGALDYSDSKFKDPNWSVNTLTLDEAKLCKAPLVILCYDESLKAPTVYGASDGDGETQPLAKASFMLATEISNLKGKGGWKKPQWLPTELSQSLPTGVPDLADLYSTARASNIEVIVYQSPMKDCGGFVRAVCLLAPLTLLRAEELAQSMQKIGQIDPPEEWEADYTELGKSVFQVFEKAAEGYNKNGKIIGISPTQNAKKTEVVRSVLRLTKEDVRGILDISSGQDEQPRCRIAGALGAIQRAVGGFNSYKDTDAAFRPVALSIESFMDDVKYNGDTEIPVVFDFTAILELDAANLQQPIFTITKGTPFPEALDKLRELLKIDTTNGKLLVALFPGIDAADWHDSFFPGKGRFYVIREACGNNEELQHAVTALHGGEAPGT